MRRSALRRSNRWIQMGVFLYLILFIRCLLLTPDPALATNWVKLQPEEVIEQARVIVQGSYDFSQEEHNLASSQMWISYQFKVEQYFRGSGEEIVETGIERFDVSRVKNFQAQGGTFILFLVKDQDNSGLWVPVAGPNGMLQLQDGELKSLNSGDAEKYRDFLAEQSPKAPDSTRPYVLVGAVAVLGGIIVAITRWRIR